MSATHLGYDLRALLEPPRFVTAEGGGWQCGSARATARDEPLSSTARRPNPPSSFRHRAASHAVWAAADLGRAWSTRW